MSHFANPPLTNAERQARRRARLVAALDIVRQLPADCDRISRMAAQAAEVAGRRGEPQLAAQWRDVQARWEAIGQEASQL